MKSRLHSTFGRRLDPARQRKGFALIITVTLLAFLVLLLASLATVTRIETTATGNVLQLARARQNALTALDIALGQLQAAAGPDQRATATADALASGVHWTGVWDAKVAGATPLTWLVSGNEGEDWRAQVPRNPPPNPITLVGPRTAGTSGDVVVARQPLQSSLLYGQKAAAVTGHFAWWVSDQGLKAPVIVPDRRAEVSYPPFDRAEDRKRLAQQFAIGGGPTEFELRDPINRSLADRILILPQTAFLAARGGDQVGLTNVRLHFHSWSPNNFAVLANGAEGGLRRDLSLDPGRLGPAFAAWSNYRGYMEDPANPIAPFPLPGYPGADPRVALRRRYRLTAAQTANGVAHGVAPVLSHLLLTFNVRTDQSVGGAIRPLEVRARWMVSLWNPYSSALVPEDLMLEVAGLPTVQVVNDTAGGLTVAAVPLQDIYGPPFRLNIPWLLSGRADQQSWLPGRVYSWTSLENLNKGAAAPDSGFASQFYVRNFNVAGQGVQRVASTATMSNSAQCHLAVTSLTRLVFHLYRGLGTARELLATFHAPDFAAFSTTPATASAGTYQFSFFFRLAESIDTVATPEVWLTSVGQDPRETDLPSGSYVPGANGNRPELYANFASSSFPDRLLDRSLPVSDTSTTGQSYNEDTPLFEFPRAPLLSLGAMQHLHTAGTRPFAIGNSWGRAGGWNALFDRYFFSGFAGEVELPELVPPALLPNSAMKILTRRSDGAAVTRADLEARRTDGFSAAHLLQGAAFNINSTQREAWVAVLRSGRRIGEDTFTALNPSPVTGTAADADTVALELPGSVFWRFSHSAQETFRSDAGYAASATVPPTAPNVASLANTHLFRTGTRRLSDAQTGQFADAIVGLLTSKIRASGPFFSCEEFLNPSSLFLSAGGVEVSLLEKAIEMAELNRDVDEFSSQWLTQADVVTLLAPVMFARSDTFLIRAYGDTVNPASGALEGNVWVEAIAQRLPEYVDPAQPAETQPAGLNPTNLRFGRRFRVVSFRWLTVFDI